VWSNNNKKSPAATSPAVTSPAVTSPAVTSPAASATYLAAQACGNLAPLIGLLGFGFDHPTRTGQAQTPSPPPSLQHTLNRNSQTHPFFKTASRPTTAFAVQNHNVEPATARYRTADIVAVRPKHRQQYDSKGSTTNEKGVRFHTGKTVPNGRCSCTPFIPLVTIGRNHHEVRLLSCGCRLTRTFPHRRRKSTRKQRHLLMDCRLYG
jgi:hypothetical protein